LSSGDIVLTGSGQEAGTYPALHFQSPSLLAYLNQSAILDINFNADLTSAPPPQHPLLNLFTWTEIAPPGPKPLLHSPVAHNYPHRSPNLHHSRC
jgi:hypothetical protein